MLRHRVDLHQALVAYHPNRKADIRQLDKHQPGPEVIAHFVIANNRRTRHRQQRTQHIAPAQAAFAQQVINQGDIERRQHRKQQEFRDRQIDIRAEAKQIHDAELHRAHQHVQQNGFEGLPAQAQERQEHQCSQPNAHQHGEVAVDVSGKVFTDQAEREGPQDSGDNE
ncbi:hypothetical protein D3C76_1294800 [compost metagenome]